MKDEINEKKIQMHVLEQRIMGSLEESDLSSSIEMSQVLGAFSRYKCGNFIYIPQGKLGKLFFF
jgi:hypothetical protein